MQFCFYLFERPKMPFLPSTRDVFRTERRNCLEKWMGGGGGILYSHGTKQKKGVCILISPQFNDFQIEYSCSEAEGWIILANISINSFQISLCNIYAPNNLQMQNTFVKDLNQCLLSNANVSRLIVRGDWNVALGAIDKRGGIPWRPTTYRDFII